MQFSYLIISILIIVGIFVALSSSVSLKPFMQMTVLNNLMPREGFSGSSANNQVRVDSYEKVAVQTNKKGCKTVIGLNGLFCDPNAESIGVDLFSDVPGAIGSSNGFGLTNSKGDLQLNDEQMKLLRTRGGNMTGKEAQIGH